MSVKAKIIEIFRSIQGEGKYAGMAQVFVRFFECNMHCVWCDTPHSIGDTTRNFTEYSLDELDQEITRISQGCKHVSLTGGEPLLQADIIQALSHGWKASGLSLYLDTNGTLPNELEKIISQIDTVAMDMKLPSSTQCRPYWQEHKEFLKIARQKDVFVKTVISSATSADDVRESADIVAGIDPDILYILQPNSFELGNGVVKKCQDFQSECLKRLNNVRVIPQIHRMLKVR